MFRLLLQMLAKNGDRPIICTGHLMNTHMIISYNFKVIMRRVVIT